MSIPPGAVVPSSPGTPPPAPAAGRPSAEERKWAVLAHLSTMLGLAIPFGTLLGPLAIWLAKKDSSPFVDDQAREALNFNITVALAAVVCSLLALLVVGFVLIVLLGMAWLVLTIVATVKANDGVAYRYPFIFRLVS